MAFFDLKAYATLIGQGQTPLGAAGSMFGVPSCLMNLAADVLRLLPSRALFGILGELESGRSMANSTTRAILSKLRTDYGIIEWDTEEGGFRFVSASSKMGYESNQGGTLGAIGALIEGVSVLGSNLYTNYRIAQTQIDQIKECLGSYRNYLKFRDGAGNEQLSKLDPVAYEDFLNDEYMMEMAALRQAIDFENQLNNKIKEVQDIITERINDPTLEPMFSCDAADIVEGTGLPIECGVPKESKPVFRLVYGPPRSSTGQFMLSNDGIYYDSQSSGITPALVYLQERENRLNDFRALKWKLDYDPNLGGRGDAFSTKDLDLYVNTLLDPNVINDDVSLQVYYDKDGFLQELIGNKNKRIYDISAQIAELEGAGAPDAVIYNYRQSLLSENAQYQQVINKRKKQIELAVILPQAYTYKILYKPGDVPINDFSYLAGINIGLDLEKQKQLSFSQVEIDGVVSPLQLSSTFVVAKVNTPNTTLEHLIIPELSEGAIIFDGSSVSSTNSVILPAESFITTDNMIAMYNFLDTNFEDPSSTSFTLRNSHSLKDEYYAQLVTESQESVFRRGLGIAYLEGITKQSSTSPQEVSALGSFIKLPPVKKFDDLLYNREGATIDFWVHMPNMQCASGGYDLGGSSLFRLVLANENTGSEQTGSNSNIAGSNNFGTQFVRGFMMGFTRDRRLTSGLTASNDLSANPASSTCFFIAPTQSTSLSSVGFINRSNFDNLQCVSGNLYHCMIQPLNSQTLNGSYLSACGSRFCHLAVTFDRDADMVRFYLDGQLATASSMSYVFGMEPNLMPNLPSFKKPNSFQYSLSTLNSNAPTSLKYGPKLNKYFTPWIVGGGYTDGMYSYGNFMGGQYGGIKSGLLGYLGSLKFYSKALTSEQIYENYRAQRGFFLNIDTSLLAPNSCLD